jgi:hypothetical protein
MRFVWVACHYGMVRPWVAVGRDGFQKSRVAANILDKQSGQPTRGTPSCLGSGEERTTLIVKSESRNITHGL